jgi:hypothetical protein
VKYSRIADGWSVVLILVASNPYIGLRKLYKLQFGKLQVCSWSFSPLTHLQRQTPYDNHIRGCRKAEINVDATCYIIFKMPSFICQRPESTCLMRNLAALLTRKPAMNALLVLQATFVWTL